MAAERQLGVDGLSPELIATVRLVDIPPKASSAEHAAENAGAGAVRLTEAEIARIADGFPLGPWPVRLPML